MEASRRETLEREIRRHRDAGDLQRAAAVAIEGFGPEIFGFLIALHRSEDDAAEVFSQLTERLWRGLAAFEWQCTFRTWAYTIARNLSVSYRQDARRRARAQVPLSRWSELSALEEKVRSQTASYLRTQNRTRAAALRETLSPEDQELLVLRVDKQLSWIELARVMSGHEDAANEDAANEDAANAGAANEGQSSDDAALKREAARLRKRFQLIKERLHELGRREGLLGSERDP